jgi:hypothetical protein
MAPAQIRWTQILLAILALLQLVVALLFVNHRPEVAASWAARQPSLTPEQVEHAANQTIIGSVIVHAAAALLFAWLTLGPAAGEELDPPAQYSNARDRGYSRIWIPPGFLGPDPGRSHRCHDRAGGELRAATRGALAALDSPRSALLLHGPGRSELTDTPLRSVPSLAPGLNLPSVPPAAH